MIQSVIPATAMEESNKAPFYGPSEHALSLRLIKLISNGLLPLLAKVDESPDASSSESIPVWSSSKVNNPLRNPIRNTAEWKALKNGQNPLRDPVKDIREFKALKQVSM